MLVRRDLQRQYTTFRLGYVWTLLEPLGMAAVLWFVFSVLLGARDFGLNPYLLFIVAGVLPWWWFLKGMRASTKVLRRARGELVFSLLPTQVWILRVIISSGVEFILSLPILLLAMVLTQALPGPLIALFPVAILVQFVVMYGLALIIAPAVALTPDLGRTVRIVLRAMFYFTPILYTLGRIPETFQNLAAINPLVGVLGLYRIGWWPGEAISTSALLISLASAAVILVIGLIVFRRLEPRVLKEV
jgi:ABC-2 type transport system permease protein